jgi:hypothetical protein
MDILTLVVVFSAAIVAGAINAIAGGGTVFSFTALAWTGLPLIIANTTNQTALVPGSVGGIIAFRRELIPQWRAFLVLLTPTIAASLLGAKVVTSIPEDVFRRSVPFLVLFATLVFAARNLIIQWALRQPALVTAGASIPIEQPITPIGYVLGMVLQFIIALYGGYFGAGIGILMLTSMSVMGMRDIIKMNALKNALAAGINGTAAMSFILDSKVEWSFALLGALGSLIGGYVLASLARRINQDVLRLAVVIAGVVVSAWLYIRLQ